MQPNPECFAGAAVGEVGVESRSSERIRAVEAIFRNTSGMAIGRICPLGLRREMSVELVSIWRHGREAEPMSEAAMTRKRMSGEVWSSEILASCLHISKLQPLGPVPVR